MGIRNKKLSILLIMFSPISFWNFTDLTPPQPGLTYGRWVGTRQAGTNQRAVWSDDGITWNIATTPNSYIYQGVDFSPELGLYVAVASDAQTNNIMTSTNSVTWTARSKANTAPLISITWCSAWNQFIAVGGNPMEFFISSDGISWTASSFNIPNQNIFFNHKGNFVETPSGYIWAVATSDPSTNNCRIVYSTDGVNFASASVANMAVPRNMRYNPTDDRWIIVNSSNTNIAISSTISTGWTTYAEALAGGSRFGLETSDDLYVITNTYNTTTTAATKYSSTGLSGTWTASTFPSTNHQPVSISYSPTLNQWVTQNWPTTTFYTSNDAITWTARTGSLNTVIFTFGDGVRTTAYKQGADK